MKIQNIYDNGGKSADRYTVVYDRKYANGVSESLHMSGHPSHLQSIRKRSTRQDGEHLGRKIGFFDLPVSCQKAVLQDLDVFAQ